MAIRQGLHSGSHLCPQGQAHDPHGSTVGTSWFPVRLKFSDFWLILVLRLDFKSFFSNTLVPGSQI